ncbi:MAG: glycosyltransferase [Micrococcales bacterium]|nr:glycosyltransferase [Micrococcales bacterium]
MKVLAVAPPFAGHLNPLLTLAEGLRDHGVVTTFATGATKAPLVRRLGFDVDMICGDDPHVFDRIADTAGPVRSSPRLLTRQLRANLALLPQARAELREIVDRARPDAVLADFTAPVAGMVATERGIPWLTTTPTPFALETRTGTPSYCGGWGPARHPWHRWRDALGRTATRVTKRGMERVLASSFTAAGTGVYREDGSEAAYSPTQILGLGMTELELPRDWPDVFTMVGPVTATPETWPVPPVLPEGPFVLVTVGTHLRWAKHDLIARATRLAEAVGHQVVVSLGDAARAEPKPVETHGTVHVFGYLPYDAVVPRARAVVHHGGAGITYSCVRAGVPAVVVPHDYDQFDFAARVVAAGAGIRARRVDDARALRATLDLDRTRLDALSRAAATYDPVAAVAAALLRHVEQRDAT